MKDTSENLGRLPSKRRAARAFATRRRGSGMGTIRHSDVGGVGTSTPAVLQLGAHSAPGSHSAKKRRLRGQKQLAASQRPSTQ